MNNRSLLIAIICGLATAVLLLAPSRIGGIGALLAPIAILPLFIASLGFGMVAGIASALVASAVIATLFGILPALGALLLNLMPAVWVGMMAGLARVDGEEAEWFPLSTMLYRMAVMSALLAVAFGWMLGYSADTGKALIEQLYTDIYANASAQNPSVIKPSQEAIAGSAAQISGLLPVVMPASLLLMYVWNMSLGARFCRAMGWMHRPKDDISATTALPLEAVVIFALALALLLFGGNVALVGKVFAGAMGAAFMLVGFAVLHFVTKGVAGRTAILTVVYLFTFFAAFPVFLFVILGLAETLVGVRSRFQSPPTS